MGKFIRWIIVVVIVLGATVAQPQVATLVPLPIDVTGELNGVVYRIRVPADWNGTLLVYAHGYTGANPPILALQAAEVTTLLSRGFALAASRFEGTGWNVKEGMQDTVALTSYFRDTIGRPTRTIMWGGSMGGLMTLGLIEKFPGLYDGAVALCPPASGTPRRFDLGLDIALAYSVVFDWRPEWGTPGNLRDDLNYVTEVLPYLNLTIDQKGPWEFIRLLNKIPEDSFYAPLYFNRTNMYFATGVRAELEHRAGGPISSNIGRKYELSADDKLYLWTEFGINANPLLAQMNLPANKYAADRNARNYVEHYVNPSGRITRPVITMHTSGDALAIPSHEDAYRKQVEARGNLDLLVQQYASGIAHCAFTPDQDLAAIDAMMYWLDTGIRPDQSFFTSPGFLPNFVPEPWPW